MTVELFTRAVQQTPGGGMTEHGAATSGRDIHKFAPRLTVSPRAVRNVAAYLAIAALALSIAVVVRHERATAAELVTNPSVETVAPTNAALPLGWSPTRWGVHTATMTHATGDAHTGSRYTRVAISGYATGDARWSFGYVPVQPNTSYTFSDWYRSTVTTHMVAQVVSTSGTVSWIWLRSVPPATAWTQASGSFTTPANAASATVYHLINANGTLDTDDSSMLTTTEASGVTTSSAPTTTIVPGSKPVLYLTFDDGPGVDSAALLSVLARHGVKATFFLMGIHVRDLPASAAFIAADGHAIGNHSDTHPDLTTLTEEAARAELERASASIREFTGITPTCHAAAVRGDRRQGGADRLTRTRRRDPDHRRRRLDRAGDHGARDDGAASTRCTTARARPAAVR